MEIKYEEVNAEDLEPGDLFSKEKPFYWKHVQDKQSIGEKVYIKTEESCPPSERKIKITKIEVTKDDKKEEV